MVFLNRTKLLISMFLLFTTPQLLPFLLLFNVSTNQILTLSSFILLLMVADSNPNMLMILMVSSLSTFMVLSATSAYSSFCYGMLGTQILITSFLFGSYTWVLSFLFTLNFACTLLAYLRLTNLNFNLNFSILLLVFQKLILLVFFFSALVRLSTLMNFSLMFLFSFLTFASFSSMLLLLISTVQMAFVGNSGLDFSDVQAIMFVVYGISVCFLMMENMQISVLFSLLWTCLVFGLPLIFMNIFKILISSVSDFMDVLGVSLGYLVSILGFVEMMKSSSMMTSASAGWLFLL